METPRGLGEAGSESREQRGAIDLRVLGYGEA